MTVRLGRERGREREVPSLYKPSQFLCGGPRPFLFRSNIQAGVWCLREDRLVSPPSDSSPPLFLTTASTMADLSMPVIHDTEPHPYLHEPVLYISGLPCCVTDDEIALVFQPCAKFRLKINREEPHQELYGTIEFQYLDRGHSHPSVSIFTLVDSNPLAAEKALACLHSKPFPGLNPPASIVLSPYPPTDPPTPLPPASATPRLVKFLPSYYTDFQLYDLFRPHGALAAVRTRVSFAQETAMIEFWREDDARKAEDAMYCAQIDGHNIAIQSYQPRRTSGSISDFTLSPPTFVAPGYPYPVNQVFTFPEAFLPESHGPHQVFAPTSKFPHRAGQLRPRSWSTSPTCTVVRPWLE